MKYRPRRSVEPRADRQARLGYQGLGKFTRGGECGNFTGPPLEGLETLVAPSVKAVGDGELQFTRLNHLIHCFVQEALSLVRTRMNGELSTKSTLVHPRIKAQRSSSSFTEAIIVNLSLIA